MRVPPGASAAPRALRSPARLLLGLLLSAVLLPPAALVAQEPGVPVQVLVHGGAGSLRPGMLDAAGEQAVREALAAALFAAWDVLDAGGSALDAVETAVRSLENDPHFNAGRGAVLNADGRAQLDASIMEGTTRRAGAVAAVEHIRNPVGAARAVMERTPHVLLVGRDADLWAARQGLETVDASYFYVDRSLGWLGGKVSETAGERGTVGAVAIDREGGLAAATSTGGLSGKLPGRVGDSPIPGAGTWADESCAVSGTGQGELFIRYTIARDLCAAVAAGQTLAQAARHLVHGTLVAAGADGGLIALTGSGDFRFDFNTPSLLRGRIDAAATATTWLYDETDAVPVSRNSP